MTPTTMTPTTITPAKSRYLEAPVSWRAFVRARESSLIVLAAVIGAIGGLAVAAMSGAVNVLHAVLFNLPLGARLSGQTSLNPVLALLVPSLGGLGLGIALMLLPRWRPPREIDPIEANALHGGRMSFRGSVVVALQTIWSCGVGASVGLEAGYTQLSSGLAASLGRGFHLRRADQRIMVGCGAAAAIAGAFGAPLAGAFYAFELVVGGYTPASLTPVGVAAVIGYFASRALTPFSVGVVAGQFGVVHSQDLVFAASLGVVGALFGIGIMRCVALCEWLLSPRFLWPPLRPMLGGLFVGMMALATPQVMASGHGALHLVGLGQMTLAAAGLVFGLKTLASIVSLGSGFRGGLFFASLLLGALGGRLFAAALGAVWPGASLDPNVYSIIGMGALSASIIGGPLTMTFIALETTGDLWLTTAVLVAVIISTQLTRELFGYSFATWRFHLRGETIRSAADVGWIRDLTVGRMMRRDVTSVDAAMPLAEFRARFPLGSKNKIIAEDDAGRYRGIIFVADAHAPDNAKGHRVADLLHYEHTTLLPSMDVREAVAAFDRAEAEVLAVINTPEDRKVVGLLTETHTLRRYSEESERRRREVLGEDK